MAIKIENKRQQLRCQQNKSAAAISLFDSKRDKLFRPALGPDGPGPGPGPFFYSSGGGGRKKLNLISFCYISQSNTRARTTAYTISSFLSGYFIN